MRLPPQPPVLQIRPCSFKSRAEDERRALARANGRDLEAELAREIAWLVLVVVCGLVVLGAALAGC